MTYKGLNPDEVIKNRKKYGMNKLSPKKSDTFLSLFLETLGDPIIKILLIALGIKIVFLFKSFDWYETIGIVIAILIASLISSISEYGSAKAFKRLEEESKSLNSIVIRSSIKKSIPSEEIVYDDIVCLEQGNKVPADGVLISGSVSVNESFLSGETKDKIKKSSPSKTFDEDNFVYMGSVITSGEGVIKVVNVGDNTFYGKLASEVGEKSDVSPLKKRLNSLAKNISIIGYISALLGSLSYLFNIIVINNNFDINLIKETITNIPLMLGFVLNALTICVTIIVVCVPEGLPMMITLVLSSNMKKMLKDNVLVRRLVGIETAGSLNILFTDKTGTLTKGNLEVIGFTLGSGNNYCNIKEVQGKYADILKKSLIYNNDSYYINNTISGGNTTDRALFSFVKENKSSKYKITDSVKFNSEKKYSIVVINDGKNSTKLVKGAPEVIVNGCNSYYDERGEKNVLDKKIIMTLINKYTKKGIRVVALATKDASYSLEYLKNMTLVAIMLIKDEIRPSSAQAINRIERGGIDVVMITGDNRDTAKEIASEIGLVKSANDLVYTSSEINSMSDEEIKAKLHNIKVIARALPSDKSRLVKLAKENNLVVGMTGDGINDAPALKKADVGFAMGSGTEVAKEAADIVILDDNITSITKAILYGRNTFKSIRKFIICQLSTNLCALSTSIIGPFIGIPVPVTVVQMLWINMVMDTLSGLAFSYEPPLDEYLEESPKKKDESIINKYMLSEIIVAGIYNSFLCIFFLKSEFISSLFRQSSSHEYLLTAFFGLFIFLGIFNSFNARTHRLNLFANLRDNKAFLVIIFFICFVQIYLIYYGGELFRTSGLTAFEFLIMVLLAFTIIPIDFTRKIILKLNGHNNGV